MFAKWKTNITFLSESNERILLSRNIVMLQLLINFSIVKYGLRSLCFFFFHLQNILQLNIYH